MNIVDLAILVFIISAVFRGASIGFIRQLLSTIGFFGGLMIGFVVQKHVTSIAVTDTSKILLSLGIVLGLAFLFLAIGEYIGIILKRRVHSLAFRPADTIDNAGGSLISVVTILVMVWLSASVLSPLPYPSIQSALRGSSIISFLNKSLPPAPNLFASFNKIIQANSFPQVFSGAEPVPSNISLPSLGSLNTAVNKDKASVVKIKGQGCGGIVEGSGFIVGNGLVATNAHVVAGISHPYVDDNSRGLLPAKAIWFDPKLDFAVLKVTDLTGKALPLKNSDVERGTPAAVMGYPEGGNFSAGPAVVADKFLALGKDIYGQSLTKREVYALRAHVVPGNSGGPLVDSNGTVVGVVFAESTSYKDVGYALTSNKIVEEIAQAKQQNHTVSTQSCAE